MDETLLYFRVTDIWKEFCELHTKLFDVTCEEYSLLLQSDIDHLENKVLEKELLIETISLVEKLRSEIIAEMNEDSNIEKKISNSSDLLTHFSQFSIEKEQRHLFNFNSLLIDIIEKVQAQNKKNQLFISKAISGLREIREDAAGIKSYQIYEKTGKQKTKSVQV